MRPRFGPKHVLLVFVVGTVVLGVAGLGRAEIMSHTTFTMDFTKEDAGKKAEWSPAKMVTAGPTGLGWGDSTDRGSRDFWVQTTEPVALGLSWRPVNAITITATVEGTGPSSGQLFARYSPDAKHWSTWQLLLPADIGKADLRRQLFRGSLRVPNREQQRYGELLQQYMRRDDVAWSCDEEALVVNILRGDPKFFEKSLPFIGYVQFLYEGGLQGGERIRSMRVDIPWCVSGLQTLPKDKKAQQYRDGPWRFKAPGGQ